MQNHLYVISFTVGSESGLALVAAQDDRSAFQILKNGGSRNGAGYSLVQIRDIGMTCDCHYGLLMESFVNALTAYNAIVNAANKLVGPKGDKGDDGSAVDVVKYTPQSLTDEQKSQARENIGSTSPEVFWVTFGETPYLEVLDAHNSGKLCVCKYNGHMYYLSQFHQNMNKFFIYFDELEGSANEDQLIDTVFVSSDGRWDTETGYYVVGENSATYWNDKVDKVTGKGLSTNDYTDADEKKVSLIDNSLVVDIVDARSGGGQLSGYNITKKHIDSLTGEVSTRTIQLSDIYTTNGVTYALQFLTAEQKAQARSNIGAGTYTKPSSGIPASDLAAGVIPTKFILPMDRVVGETPESYAWHLNGVTSAEVYSAYAAGRPFVVRYSIAGIWYGSSVLSYGDDMGGFGLVIYFVNGDNGSVESVTI